MARDKEALLLSTPVESMPTSRSALEEFQAVFVGWSLPGEVAEPQTVAELLSRGGFKPTDVLVRYRKVEPAQTLTLLQRGKHNYIMLPIRYLAMLSFNLALLIFFVFLLVGPLLGVPRVLHWSSVLFGILGAGGLFVTTILMIQESNKH